MFAPPPARVIHRDSRGGFVAEMDRDALMFVLEDRDEFEPRAESFEILTQRRHSHVFGVFQLHDRTLSHVESPGQRRSAHGLAVTKFVEANLFECFRLRSRDAFGRSRTTLTISQGS